MSMAYLLIPVALLAISLTVSIVMVKKGKPVKKAMRVHFLSLVLIVAVCCALPFAASAEPADAGTDGATASDTVEETTGESGGIAEGLKYLSAALAVGLAGIGGGIAVASGAPAAIGATAEDPKAFGKSIIFVALGEGFGLYGLLISIMIILL